MCNCSLCQSREQNKHPYELYFGNKREADFVRMFPDLPIYEYEKAAKGEKEFDEKAAEAKKTFLESLFKNLAKTRKEQ